ncbi:MAG: rRNA methyltransferase [Candidatus Altiarchaeales archaeon ex4484_43]|nr:MAG: rRNA methyltransferase [Candidatus Altiarchaeales archaeon ex4484_43]RLI89095.1 MAG: RNA methyltransferase [Candidatus Altiarchaeales archaeon]
MPTFSVILVEPRYEGNIGSVARVMKNFGFNELILINPVKLGKEARAMAMHGRDILENAEILDGFEKLKEKFDFLIATTSIVGTDRNLLRTPVFPEDLKNSITLDGKIGLVFGREDYGLYNEEIEACDLLVSIPASEEYPTLNLSHSVAILLYEISRQRFENRKKRLKKFRKADLVEKEVLLEKFDSFVDSVHDREQDAKLAKKTFRQLIGRAFISGRESFTLIGLFRKARDRIKKQNKKEI